MRRVRRERDRAEVVDRARHRRHVFGRHQRPHMQRRVPRRVHHRSAPRRPQRERRHARRQRQHVALPQAEHHEVAVLARVDHLAAVGGGREVGDVRVDQRRRHRRRRRQAHHVEPLHRRHAGDRRRRRVGEDHRVVERHLLLVVERAVGQREHVAPARQVDDVQIGRHRHVLRQHADDEVAPARREERLPQQRRVLQPVADDDGDRRQLQPRPVAERGDVERVAAARRLRQEQRRVPVGREGVAERRHAAGERDVGAERVGQVQLARRRQVAPLRVRRRRRGVRQVQHLARAVGHHAAGRRARPDVRDLRADGEVAAHVEGAAGRRRARGCAERREHDRRRTIARRLAALLTTRLTTTPRARSRRARPSRSRSPSPPPPDTPASCRRRSLLQ